MPSNSAAWLTAAKANPLEVKPAPYHPPGEHELVIKNAAVAINPVDWKIQDHGIYISTYPTILGEDIAGTVFEAGSAVTRFRPGDRVLAHPVGMATHRDRDNGFQLYTVVPAHMAAPIPADLSFAHAAVIPLGLSTAAAALFEKTQLSLSHPSLSPTPTGQSLLIWGGATSVGANAIQLAVAAGYDVVATASAHNHAFVKKLGATAAFDYNSVTIEDDLVAALHGKTLAGALDTININGALQSCIAVVTRSQGAKTVSTVLPAPAAETLPAGVSVRGAFAVTIRDNEVSRVIYEEYLPRALAEGKFVAAPEPVVVGQGLESVQAGLDAQRKGVSARKVVVTL